MTEPIKACVDVDLRVAKLAGIRTRLSRRYSLTNGWSVRCCRIDKPGVQCSPTTNPADAWEAAEAVGLFDPAKHNMQYWERRDGTCRVGYFLTGRAKTGATFCLAICEAILATAEKGGSNG